MFGEYTDVLETMQLAPCLLQNSESKLRNVEKMYCDNRMDKHSYEIYSERCRVLINIFNAEMNRFHDDRVQDVRESMLSVLKSMYNYHSSMGKKIEEMVSLID